jgi:hypothetical protein
MKTKTSHWMIESISRRLAEILICAVGGMSITGTAGQPESKALDRTPRISPDYAGVVIPPNIAPLNFRVLEPMDEAGLRISSNSGEPVELNSRDGSFRIPIRAWKKLLDQNRGQSLTFSVRVRKDGREQTFRPIVNRIARESIDPYLAYRLINPAYSLWTEMGLYQRNLETFDEKPILVNRLTQGNCMNCHNFRNNDPDCMLMHLRTGPGSGTLIRRNGEIRKVNTSTDFNKAGAYPSWHPNGNIIAFSVNALSMFFHAKGESRDVLDSASDLVLYIVDKNMITTGPGIANPDRMETFPCWAPDGKTLYFCASDKLDSYVGMRNGREDLFWETIRYDLMRISYKAETDAWGKPETVISAKEAGGSITEPRVSPDGRYLIFTKADYGNFPIYLKSADIHLLDLATGSVKRMECNSGQTDSFHSWSSGGRWFVFSSKRLDGFTARPYFSYVDGEGQASKPLVMPQEDPAFYDSFLKTYNVPELVRGPITVNPREWTAVAMGQTVAKAKLDPRVKSGELGVGKQTQPADTTDLYQKAHR